MIFEIFLKQILLDLARRDFIINCLREQLENTVNNAYAFNHLHELELIKCFEEQQ